MAISQTVMNKGFMCYRYQQNPKMEINSTVKPSVGNNHVHIRPQRRSAKNNKQGSKSINSMYLIPPCTYIYVYTSIVYNYIYGYKLVLGLG